MGGEQTRRRGANRNGRARGEETFRVCFDEAEAEELRDLIKDAEGDADEDVLDTAREALRLGMKRDMPEEDRVVVRLTKGEKDACRRAIDAEEGAQDREVLEEVARKVVHALEKHKLGGKTA